MASPGPSPSRTASPFPFVRTASPRAAAAILDAAVGPRDDAPETDMLARTGALAYAAIQIEEMEAADFRHIHGLDTASPKGGVAIARLRAAADHLRSCGTTIRADYDGTPIPETDLGQEMKASSDAMGRNDGKDVPAAPGKTEAAPESRTDADAPANRALRRASALAGAHLLDLGRRLPKHPPPETAAQMGARAFTAASELSLSQTLVEAGDATWKATIDRNRTLVAEHMDREIAEPQTGRIDELLKRIRKTP